MSEISNVKKVKINGDKISIEFEKTNTTGGLDTYKITSEDQPAPELYKAFGELSKLAGVICKFPEEITERIKIEAVSVKEGKNVLVTIDACIVREFGLIEISFGTSHASDNYYNQSLDIKYPSKYLFVLNQIFEEAKRFCKGQRAQMSLFEPEEVA